MALLPSDPKKQQQIAIGLVPLVLLAAFYYFVHSPATVKADDLESRVEAITIKNDAQRAIVARFGTDLDRRIAIFQEHIAQLEQLIPRREDVPLLINQITEQALTYDVELVGLNPSNDEPGDFYAKQNYELQVLGGYHQIGEYLTSIASLSRIMRPHELKVSVEAPSEDGSPPVLRGAFRVETFVMPVDSIVETTTTTAAVPNAGN